MSDRHPNREERPAMAEQDIQLECASCRGTEFVRHVRVPAWQRGTFWVGGGGRPHFEPDGIEEVDWFDEDLEGYECANGGCREPGWPRVRMDDHLTRPLPASLGEGDDVLLPDGRRARIEVLETFVYDPGAIVAGGEWYPLSELRAPEPQPGQLAIEGRGL